MKATQEWAIFVISFGPIYLADTDILANWISVLVISVSVSVLVTNMLVQIYRYRQKYHLAEYINISWTHIGPTLFVLTALS
jgi:hypothetical protein